MKLGFTHGRTHDLTYDEALEYLTAKGERFEELKAKLNTSKIKKLKIYKVGFKICN